jgi:hypothetical protein
MSPTWVSVAGGGDRRRRRVGRVGGTGRGRTRPWKSSSSTSQLRNDRSSSAA